MDHLERARDVQLARFRAMTMAERWKAAHRLYWSARRLKASYLRTTHPDWSEERVQAAVRESFMHVRD